jgi:hypothetical protein
LVKGYLLGQNRAVPNSPDFSPNTDELVDKNAQFVSQFADAGLALAAVEHEDFVGVEGEGDVLGGGGGDGAGEVGAGADEGAAELAEQLNTERVDLGDNHTGAFVLRDQRYQCANGAAANHNGEFAGLHFPEPDVMAGDGDGFDK